MIIFGPEEMKGDSAEDQGEKPSGLQNATGLQPCEGKPNDWDDIASC